MRTQAPFGRLGRALMERLDVLAGFTDEPGRLTRLFLSPAHKAAAAQVRAWMEEAGMTTTFDPIGNVVGLYEAAAPDAPVLLLGSHIDSVRDAGRYDGTLGVLAAIQAVDLLHREGLRLPVAIEVLAFGDEEGVRFPGTLSGSRAVAGTFDPAVLDARDQDGISLREALLAFGCDPAAIPSIARRRPILGYVELHIEQGPVLHDEHLPIGVVTAIAGASRFRIELEGVRGPEHAGTVPMNKRTDALAAVAEMISDVELLAKRTPDLVATVGWLEVPGGAVNVVPGAARFTLDIRSPDDATRHRAIEDLDSIFLEISYRREVRLRMERTYDAPAVACAPWLQDRLAAAVERFGIPARRLSSGAGHDGLAMIDLCPIGMLFLRCKDGISHNPAESITVEDADLAVRVLVAFLEGFEAFPDAKSEEDRS